jgi:hypothetical protein
MADVLPEHMDRWSRNQRLYETLKGLGLFVSPIPEPNDPTKIKEMIVAADLPFEQTGQGTPETSVLCMMQGPEVRKVVAAADATGENVVNFPSVL